VKTKKTQLFFWTFFYLFILSLISSGLTAGPFQTSPLIRKNVNRDMAIPAYARHHVHLREQPKCVQLLIYLKWLIIVVLIAENRLLFFFPFNSIIPPFHLFLNSAPALAVFSNFPENKILLQQMLTLSKKLFAGCLFLFRSGGVKERANSFSFLLIWSG